MLTWSGFSAPGTRYGNLNQDSFLAVSSRKNETLNSREKDTREGEERKEVFLFGVFDGHSILGEKASECAKQSFERSFQQLSTSSSDEIQKGLREMFFQAHDEILKIYENPPEKAHYAKHGRDQSFVLTDDKTMYQAKDDNLKPIEFGCTAASLLVLPEEVWIGWVGDSRILVCYQESKDTDSLSCFYATVDHNTQNEKEYNRLSDGQVEAGIRPDGYVEIHTEGMIQNLAMTRALGHVKFAEKGGVICTPDLRKMKRKAIKYIVLMSDGVCNILRKSDLLEICQTSRDVTEAARIIVTRSIEKASMLGRSAADNSTAVVISFK